MKHAKPNRRLFIRVICAAASCLLPIFSCGLGDQMPRELRFLGATALKGSTPRDIESFAIPNLKEESVRNVAIPDGVKNAQSKSMFGGSDVRTFELRDENALVVPLHAFRRGRYTSVRVYIENLTSQPVELLTEACDSYAIGTKYFSHGSFDVSTEINLSDANRPLYVGFDCESEDFIILDNNEVTQPISGSSYYGLVHLGIEPYEESKQVEVVQGLPRLSIPEGRHTIVNPCYEPGTTRNCAVDIAMQEASGTRVSGFRVGIGR